MTMDPELAVAIPDLVPVDLGDAPAARAQNEARRVPQPREPAWDRLVVSDRSVAGGVPVRLYRPVDGAAMPAVIWLHGGAFILCGLDDSDAICSQISVATGALVINVGYRLAPEHPWPAGFSDCCAVLDWVAESAGELGVDPGRLAIAGSSAGGCLAAGVALWARDRGGPHLRYQLLTYPALDDRCRTESARRVRDAPVINSDSVAQLWKIYLAGQEADQYAAPARATDLTGLPPTMIVIAALDPLRDEAIEFAGRLRESGVDVTLHDVPETFHGFDLVQPNAAISRRTTTFYLGALAAHL